MRRTVSAKALSAALLLLFGLLLPGCGVKKVQTLPPEQVLPLRTATREELVRWLEQQAAAVHSINAITELVPSTGSAYSGVIEEYHDVRAFVLARRAWPGEADAGRPAEQIRMIGQAPVVRKDIFDMVADEKEFRILLPSKNKFIVGPTALDRRSDKPIENLRPQHLLQALFFTAPVPGSTVLLEENEWGGQRYYGLSEIISPAEGEPALRQLWWFERSRLQLVRVQRFGAAGALVTDIHYGQWQEKAGIHYPREIELLRPHDDYRLKLVIQEVAFNEPLGPEKFQLERPAGMELVQLTEKPAGTGPSQEPR